ncbi:MAG: thioredoxin-disulfide reductase [Clostridia bacterium]|nr:thioredoxin-disulfide reductase [Clostridia bacterium]
MYDIIIVGGGPAGLTASIYALRARKTVLLVEKMVIGGQVTQTDNIENYPGFESISGPELSMKMYEQAEKLGLKTVYSDVKSMQLEGDIKKVETFDGEFEAKAVILAMGAVARNLDIDSEREFRGKGVSYCATCDGNFYKNKVVAVVGGGNSSVGEALYLSNIASKVYLIHRREEFRAEKVIMQKVNEIAQTTGKIEIITNSVVKDIEGNGKVESIILTNLAEKTENEIAVDGVFVAIGRKPDTGLLEGVIELDASGYIITDEEMKTNVKGVFAAGDVRKKGLKQIVTACSDGAIAATEAIEMLNKR